MFKKDFKSSLKLSLSLLLILSMTACSFNSKKENDSATSEITTTETAETEKTVKEDKIVKDETAPTIEVNDIIVDFGKEPIFDFKVIDNIDKDIELSIIGNYDINKTGIYPMSAIAVDKAGNSTKVDFNLIVKNKIINKNTLIAKEETKTTETKKEETKYEEIDEAGKALRLAQQELNNAKNALAKEETKLTNLLAKQNELERNLENLKIDKINIENTLINQQALVQAKQAEYEIALNNLNSVEYNNAKSAINNAQKEINRLTIEGTALTHEFQDKNNELEEAQKQLTEIENQLSSLQNQLNSYNKQSLENEYAQNQTALNNAQIRLTNAQNEVIEKQKIYDDLLAQQTTSDEYLKAKEELDKASEILRLAQENKAKSENLLKDAQTRQATAQSDKNTKYNALQLAQQAKDEADAELKEANDLLNSLKANTNQLQTENTQITAEYNDAQLAVERAKQAQNDAQTKLEQATKEKEEAQAKLDAAQKAVNDAQTRLTAAQAVIDKGSLGFFEKNGSNDAVEVINNRIKLQDEVADQDFTYSDGQTAKYNIWGKTELGKQGDATSLDNMKATFDLIEKGNQLRASDEHSAGVNKNPLKITDYLMAVAQVQTNASATRTAHTGNIENQPEKTAGIGYPVGENLAWGYAGSRNPYDGWYTEEKGYYDNNTKLDQTGHYLSLINPDNNQVYEYYYTGFAITNKDGTIYTIAHGQTFDRQAKLIYDESKNTYTYGEAYATSYTVEEYRQKFNEYYDAVMAELNNAKAEIQTAEAELAALDQDAVNKAQEAINQADNDLNDANNLVTAKTAEQQKASDQKQASDQALNDATTKENEQNLKVTDLSADLSQKENQLTTATNEYNEVDKAIETIKNEINELETNIASFDEEISTAEETVQEKQKIVDNLAGSAISETELAKINEANKNLNIAKQEEVDAQTDYDQKNTKHNELETELNKINILEKQIDETNQNKTNATNNCDNLQEDINIVMRVLIQNEKEKGTYDEMLLENNKIVNNYDEAYQKALQTRDETKRNEEEVKASLDDANDDIEKYTDDINKTKDDIMETEKNIDIKKADVKEKEEKLESLK